MPRFELVSFDLQGTLSDDAFSADLWLRALPELIARGRGLSFEAAKSHLLESSAAFGQYDYRYYSISYWLEEAGVEISFGDLMAMADPQPCVFPECIDLARELSRETKVIVLSATTRDVIDFELGESSREFDRVYSTLDNLGTPGKPAAIYRK